MLIKRNGVYKTVPSNEYGIHQKAGWIKVIDNGIEEVAPKKEEIKTEPIVVEQEEEPVVLEETEPIIIEEEEPQTTKKGRNKNK